MTRYSPTHENRPFFWQTQPGNAVTLPRTISAIGIEKVDGQTKLGLISQLGAGAVLHIEGEGFDDRTIQVESDGHSFFVFAEDLYAETAGHRSH